MDHSLCQRENHLYAEMGKPSLPIYAFITSGLDYIRTEGPRERPGAARSQTCRGLYLPPKGTTACPPGPRPPCCACEHEHKPP
jgi:hypothetical protein